MWNVNMIDKGVEEYDIDILLFFCIWSDSADKIFAYILKHINYV